MTLGVVGLMLCAAPPLVGWQRAWFAERMARHAETAAGDVAQAEVQQLAQRGVDAVPALVRLAGSKNPAAASAARDAVEDQIAAWTVELSVTREPANFTRRMTIVAAALGGSVDAFDAAGRAWARRIALEIAPQADRMPAGVAAAILADCERVLDAAPNPPAALAKANPSETTNAVSTPAPAEPPWQRFGHVPPEAQPSLRAGQPLSLAPQPPAAPADAGQGDLAIVPLPDAAATQEPGAVLTPGNPVTPTPPEAAPLAVLPADDDVAQMPNPGLQFSPPRSAASPLPPPSSESAVVDVPPPARQRALLRRYRQMSERELSAELTTADPRSALMIEQQLRERRAAVTARGPGAASADTTNGGDKTPSELADRISKLPAPEARRVLRQLVTASASDADTRLEALTLLATTGDPDLAAIARQRALEDADPRVADLAMKILRDAEQVR
jgi:hypothetical protein